MRDLKLYCEEMIERYPQHKEVIDAYYQLALDEIESGESQPNEINLCVSAIEDTCNGEG